MAKSVKYDGDLFATHPDGMDFTSGHKVEPLIGGMETYAALEEAIDGAKSSVHMAYWTLEPSIKTTGKVKAKTLSGLLQDVVERGVDLRIVMADFDPVIGTMFHLDAWKAYRKLHAVADALPKDKKQHLSIMCSRHDTRWGPAARTAAQPILRWKLAEKVNTINAFKTKQEKVAYLEAAPGLWPFVNFDGKTCSIKPTAFPGFYPAAHHEKLCVIDDEIVFLGGLDITTKRKDDWEHDNAFPWHDVACRLEGPVATFFARHFRSRWNEEREDSIAFLKSLKAPEGIKEMPNGITIPELATDVPETKPVKGGVEVKPMRTISKQSRSWLSRSPTTQITEIRETYLDIISKAEDFIYIENQYIRSTAIAEALSKRAKQKKQLELLMVLPLIPEDAFVEDEPNIATRHGQYLREKNTDMLYDAFGDRLGIYCMQMPRDDKLPDPEEDDPDEIIKNTIYIHAKTMVCDDKIAIIGSANLNDRSLVTDTETAIAWRGADSVKKFRVRLWEHALDMDTSKWTSEHLKRWNGIALKNAKGTAEERQGFIVPLPRHHLDAHAKKSWLVPDELV
jgi:phosphatidylserine/phosphatidylglycerophosphate/cardiolipin synthase-like enzyme